MLYSLTLPWLLSKFQIRFSCRLLEGPSRVSLSSISKICVNRATVKHLLNKLRGGSSTLRMAGIQLGPAGHPTSSCHRGPLAAPGGVQFHYTEFALHGTASLNLSAMARPEEKESKGLRCPMEHKAGRPLSEGIMESGKQFRNSFNLLLHTKATGKPI